MPQQATYKHYYLILALVTNFIIQNPMREPSGASTEVVGISVIASVFFQQP